MSCPEMYRSAGGLLILELLMILDITLDVYTLWGEGAGTVSHRDQCFHIVSCLQSSMTVYDPMWTPEVLLVISRALYTQFIFFFRSVQTFLFSR